MTTLLTGANGFFGQYISRAFSGQPMETLGLSNCTCNVNLAEDVPRLNGNYQQIIHAAGKAHLVPGNSKEEAAFFKVNLQGTQNLLKAIENTGQYPGSFVFISTVAVYGLETGEGITENTPLNGKTPYALSKIQAEQLIKDWCILHNVNCLIVRLPLLCGKNPPGNLGHMIKAINKGYYFRIGKGYAHRSMVLAEDVAAFLSNSVGVSGIYNLTDGVHPTFYDLEEAIAVHCQKKIYSIPMTLAQLAALTGDLLPFLPVNTYKLNKLTQSLTFSDQKAVKEIGWKPRSVLDHIELLF